MTRLVRLKDLRPGQAAEVAEIVSTDEARLLKLSGFGIVPGIVLTLKQQRPACIIRVDETELSLDGEVTEEILVRAGE